MKSQDRSKYNDVASAYHFWVELDGILVAGFSEVSGLEAETEFDEYREGGVNGYVHKLPKGVKFPNLVLKRGLTKSPALWNWYESSIDGKLTRKSGAIVLQNPDGTEFGRWNFYDAYPVKWSGPQLNAATSDVAFESVEIAHSGLYGSFSS
ncbi:phage tail protein [Paenibacillus sp. HB172176]|uniref:phage tail protein n=1 Tax=Paenibacillus sp. HB172176 TaxID=2493690 RepID=UPI00143CA628|nr:phage tail protein [Paenibacillus sp. HB172176]